MNKTLSEYLEERKKELLSYEWTSPEDYNDSFIYTESCQYFADMIKAVKNGNEISIAAFNSLDSLNQYWLKKHYPNIKLV